MPVHHVPPGFQAIVPFLVVEGAARCIDFLAAAFGAVEKFRSASPDGVVYHAELQIGDSMLMIAEPSPGYPANNALLYIYVPDVDGAYARSLAAGATSKEAPADKFYGDRNATVAAFGMTWSIGTHVEDVSPAELQRRMALQPTN